VKKKTQPEFSYNPLLENHPFLIDERQILTIDRFRTVPSFTNRITGEGGS
jgi:hypothetical protein